MGGISLRVGLSGALIVLLSACSLVVTPTQPPGTVTPGSSLTPTRLPVTAQPTPHVSRALFQVFILSPVTTCVAGDDFYTGNACYGQNCGDCNCTWEEFDPPAPITGIAPEHINDPE